MTFIVASVSRWDIELDGVRPATDIVVRLFDSCSERALPVAVSANIVAEVGVVSGDSAVHRHGEGRPEGDLPGASRRREEQSGRDKEGNESTNGHHAIVRSSMEAGQ